MPNEFELIARYFAPLARGFPGAYGLLDDVALIAPASGNELVVKTDIVVADIDLLPILFTAPPAAAAKIGVLSRLFDTPIAPIGCMTALSSEAQPAVVVLDNMRRPLSFASEGWTHFRYRSDAQ